MGECICSSCRNLKRTVSENGEAGDYICEFGFPSDKCGDCQEEGCTETCSNFISDEEEDMPRTVKCKICGKELQTVMDSDDDEFYCVNCYFNK